jgi:(R,R)-butanediol dehydrogenase/meso-butanediol dehydrogenase/diacetyl reductase
MRAAVYHGNRDVRIEELPEPNPRPGEVKLRVVTNGICGTDVHEFFDGPILTPTADHPHARTGTRAPVVIGHEFAGVVADVGEGVAAFAPGDRVVVEPLHRCGQCRFCLRGDYNLCQTIAVQGVDGPPGGLADYTVVRAEMVHRIPDELALADAALVEPLAVSYHAVRLASASPQDTVAVFGAGPIGLGVFLALRARGVERVIVVEPSEERRAMLARLGAQTVVDPGAEDAAARLQESSEGYGVDLAIDAAGSPASFAAAVAGSAKQARIVLIAVFPEHVTFQPTHLVMGEKRMIASNTYRGEDFPEVIRSLAAGAYPTDPWVTRIPLDELVEHGYEALRAGRATKVLVELDGAT